MQLQHNLRSGGLLSTILLRGAHFIDRLNTHERLSYTKIVIWWEKCPGRHWKLDLDCCWFLETRTKHNWIHIGCQNNEVAFICPAGTLRCMHTPTNLELQKKNPLDSSARGTGSKGSFFYTHTGSYQLTLEPHDVFDKIDHNSYHEEDQCSSTVSSIGKWLLIAHCRKAVRQILPTAHICLIWVETWVNYASALCTETACM